MADIDSPVYIVDDDASVREAVRSLVRSAGLNVHDFASAQEFLAHRRTPTGGCLVLYLQLPGLTGLDLQQELAKAGAEIPIIFLTGHGDIPASVRAIKAGAVDFLTKPFEDHALLSAIHQGMARHQKAAAPERTAEQLGFDDIIGTSAALRAVLQRVEVVAPTDSTVLILGETGTGKELVARAIHDRSRRSAHPFVSVNCAAIPQALVTAELFGHEKGAFTGALQRRLGRFELAAGGTLFLDEIGELPMETQVALLRVLQEREFERIGGNTPVQADVRVIAATNRDLEKAMADGGFRSDLYYRLNVFPIDIPPLRERESDIRLLAHHFVDRYARSTGKTIRSMSERSLEVLEAYGWPGNIRELQNVIERSVIVCNSEMFSVDERWLCRALQTGSTLPRVAGVEPGPAELAPAPQPVSRATTLKEIERDAIREAL